MPCSLAQEWITKNEQTWKMSSHIPLYAPWRVKVPSKLQLRDSGSKCGVHGARSREILWHWPSRGRKNKDYLQLDYYISQRAMLKYVLLFA